MTGDVGSFKDSGRLFYYACLTDKGCVREINEDNYLALADQKVFAVADGVGGLSGGEIASNMALAGVREVVSDAAPEGLLKFFSNRDRRTHGKLKRAIDKANEKVFQHAVVERKKSATTLVIAAIANGRVSFAHVGDSRAYLFREERLSQLTTDHTVAQELASRRLVASGTEKHLQYNNVITRAIGAQREIEADYSTIQLQPNDYILLCSDGLTSMVEEPAIVSILQQKKSTEIICEQCIAEAKKAGGRDNITVILINFQQRFSPQKK
jgi:protein phosphatase